MNSQPLVLAGLLLSLLTLGCDRGQVVPEATRAADTVQPEGVARPGDPQSIALTARDELFRRLSARLVEAMSSGGPAAAIEVCRREAAEIATAVGEQYDVQVGRTSFKTRNPKNAPPDWATALVAARTNEPQFTTLPSGDTAALLPIRLKAQCLVCHGKIEQIDVAVQEKLAELYPQDQATGFAEGDLRGWFWVVVPADIDHQE